jgi:hypothetical protein
MQLDKKAPALLMQADVPMSEAPAAAAKEMQQGLGPEQQSDHTTSTSKEAICAAAQGQQQENSAGVHNHGGRATDTPDSNSAVAEQAARDTLAALNADLAAELANHSAQAASGTPGSTAVACDPQAGAAAGNTAAERAAVLQGHAPEAAPAGAASQSARPSGLADAVKAGRHL